MQTSTSSLEIKLQELRQTTHERAQELKNALARLKDQQTNYISFFTYSFNIAHHQQWDNICLASYHIKNIGDYPITNPEIHLELSEASPFSFHGKFLNQGSPIPSKLKNAWIRLNDSSNAKEFRLKPSGQTVIAPGETITFSNFQIIWLPTEEYSGSIIGRTFSDQYPEGITALNAINLSGTLSMETKEE